MRTSNRRARGGVVVTVAWALLSGMVAAADATAGHSFTKIANDGTELPAAAGFGPVPGEWACSRDEVTGLVWEVKTRDRQLRDMYWTYTPYDSNPATNGGYPGYKDGTSGQCLRAHMDDGACSTEGYVAAINRAGLCGHSDWRLPTVSELVAVSHQTSDRAPQATRRPLPNTANGWYWSGVERIGETIFSRVVLLPPYGRPAFYDGSYMVLVVRGAGPPVAR